jgi:hypothetical protein
MLSRRTPQNVLGISQQQTSARPQPSSLSTNILQLHNGTLPQGVNIKLTDDCLQNLLKSAQNGYDVLVHVNRKSITIEIKTNNATSLKFDCHFQRVSGNTIHALCKSNNTFNDVANISIRAQVKPTEQTFQSGRQKAANVQKNLELESNKYRTQLLSAPITKPGERISFKNKTTVNRVGTLPKSIPNPLRNGSSSIGSTSSTITSSSSASNLSLINSNKLGSNNNAQQRGPKDYATLKQQVIHYIASGRFKTQDEIVDHIMSTGLPPGIPPESAKRKIREIICEVAEVYVNPPKIALLPKYHREINIDWEYFSSEDRERVRQALSQTEITAGNNFAPMRHSRRGPFVAPKSKMRKDPATPAMTNSTTTSPDIASDASTCSTPSPVNQMQIDNDYQMISSTKPEKRKLSSNDLSKLSTTTTTTTMTSMNSPLNNDVFQPPVKKRLIMNDSSNFPSSSKEVQPMTIESTATTIMTTKSISKSSSQSDFQKLRSSPYLKPVSSPQIQQQNGFKSNEKSEKLQNKEHHRSKEFTPIDKNQLYNGFTKSKKDEKFVVNGSNISKKIDQSNSKQTSKPQENVSTKFDEVKREKLKIAASESEKDVLCEKEKLLMEFAVESMKKEKEKEKKKKKEKIKKDNEKIVAEEKVDKRDKNVENNITKIDVNNGISTVEKKIKIEIKLEKQPKEKNEEKIEKEHRNHHPKEKSKDKKDIQKSDTTTTSMTTKTMASTIINSTLKEDTFKDPSKIVKDATKEKSSKKDKKLEENQLKEKHSSSNGKMASEKEGSLKRDESEMTKKEKKKDKEHKKEHKSSKFEGEIKAPKEKKVKTEILLNESSSSSNNIATEKPKEKEKHKEKEKSKEKEKTKEKSSKIKIETPEKSKMSTKDAASLASEKLLLKPAEKLSKPVIRETTKPPPKEFKPLNPEKLTPDDIRKIKIQDLLKLLSDPLKPSKSYEEKYPPIRTPTDAEVYAKHEMEYYELYEKAYNQLLTVQKDLSIYVERLNKSQTDQEKNKLEEKIRNYAARCLQDDNFRNQRRTVANMTKAIQVLRQRQDDYYGPEQNNP